MSQEDFFASASVDCDSCPAVVEIGSYPSQHVACDSVSLQLHQEAISPDLVKGLLQVDPGSKDNFLFLERIFNFLGSRDYFSGSQDHLGLQGIEASKCYPISSIKEASRGQKNSYFHLTFGSPLYVYAPPHPPLMFLGLLKSASD